MSIPKYIRTVYTKFAFTVDIRNSKAQANMRILSALILPTVNNQTKSIFGVPLIQRHIFYFSEQPMILRNRQKSETIQ